jgi:hypothetical protein
MEFIYGSCSLKKKKKKIRKRGIIEVLRVGGKKGSHFGSQSYMSTIFVLSI